MVQSQFRRLDVVVLNEKGSAPGRVALNQSTTEEIGGRSSTANPIPLPCSICRLGIFLLVVESVLRTRQQVDCLGIRSSTG